MGTGLCDGEGERANTGYAPHIIRNVSANVFSLRTFRHIFFAEMSAAIIFCRNVFGRKVRNRTFRIFHRKFVIFVRQLLDVTLRDVSQEESEAADHQISGLSSCEERPADIETRICLDER